MGQLYSMLYPKESNYCINLEYEDINFIDYIPVFPTIYRLAFNKSKTKINCPGSLIYLFLGNWTTVHQYVQDVLKIFTAAISPLPIMVPVIVDVLYLMEEEYRSLYKEKSKLSFDKDKCNIYHKLFVNYKKIKDSDLIQLQEDFKIFKTMINVIKKEICTKCDSRKLTPVEISQIKLFQPKEIEKEVNIAMNYYNANYPKIHKLASDVLEYINKEIINYLLKNLEIN